MYDEGLSIELWVLLAEIQAMVDMVSWSLCVLLLKSQISPHYSNLRQVNLLEFNKERCGLVRSHRSNLNSQESN